MTQYRKPTAADIGKTVEVSIDGEWRSGTMVDCRVRYWIEFEATKGCATSYTDARIPVTTAADELLVAADMLEECGMDGAAEVLRVAAERANKPTPGYWTWTITR